MKRHKKEAAFLEEMTRIPNVSLACERVGLSRNTIYRWCKEDPEFKERLEAAEKAGVESINDLAESKLIGHLNNGNLRAIQYWLDNHKNNYARPRPKSFWEEMLMRENPVTKIVIHAPEDPDKVRKRAEKKRRKS